MSKFPWVIVLLSSLLGGLALVGSLFAGGAPQQAAGAAFAIGLAVIPYCLARAVAELARPSAPPPP